MGVTDLHRLVWISGVLGEQRGSCGSHQLAAHPLGEPDPGPIDPGPGLVEDLEGLGELDDLDSDLLEDRIGILLDDREPLLAHQLGRGYRPRQIGE